MPTLTPDLSSEEAFTRTVQKVAKDLELQLSPIVPSIDIYFTARNLHITKVCWVGCIDLRVFVENLPTLEKESPHTYNYLMTNHNEAIEKAKKLLARLKLQDFLLPRIVVEEDNSSHYPKKPSKRRIQVGDDSLWWYFYARTGNNILEAGNQAEEHLKEVEVILESLCEMVASTAYEHLMSVSKSLRAEYS